MIIKLVRPDHNPPVDFALEYKSLPPHLPIPPAWAAQIAMLNVDDLELPHVLHALDSSAGPTALLHQVTFDIPAQLVVCLFVDGSTESWSLDPSSPCVSRLHRVIRNVDAATAESISERDRQIAKQRWRDHERERILTMSIPPPVTTKLSKHKKQRSLLMTLVSSFVPSARPSPSPLPPPLPPPSPPPHLSSASLREKARSALVDTYRRYVLTELARRSLPGSYYTWIIKSMLRRTADSLDDILREAGGVLPPHRPPMHHNLPPLEDLSQPAPSPSPPPSPSSPSSLDYASSDETDTDGSSVHTPSTNTCITYPPISPSFIDPQPCSDPSPVPSGDESVLSPDALATYTALSENADRLRRLLTLANSKAAHDQCDIRTRETVLEVRCRRRAWLGRRLLPSVALVDLDMSAPFERSPLGLRSWTAADVDDDEDAMDEMDASEVGPFELVEDVRKSIHTDTWNERPRGGDLRRRLGLSDNRLFPVCEEEEDDDGVLVAREMSLDLDFELDIGNDWVRESDEDDSDDESEDLTPLDLVLMERPKARPRLRMRTNSMHMRRRRLESVDLPISLSSTSLLCSPLSPKGDPVGFLDQEEEFTLSMDLPRRRSGGYERESVHERRWISGVVMECR